MTITDTSKKEIQIRWVTAITELEKLEKIWRSGEMYFKPKYILNDYLILSTLLMCELDFTESKRIKELIYEHLSPKFAGDF